MEVVELCTVLLFSEEKVSVQTDISQGFPFRGIDLQTSAPRLVVLVHLRCKRCFGVIIGVFLSVKNQRTFLGVGGGGEGEGTGGISIKKYYRRSEQVSIFM